MVGVGIDLIEIERISQAVQRYGRRFLDRVFTAGEQAACAETGSASLAARFAAKEAALKALGTGWSGGIDWRDIEVVGGRGRQPGILLHGVASDVAKRLGVRLMHLSLTHTHTCAGAVVVAESSTGGRR